MSSSLAALRWPFQIFSSQPRPASSTAPSNQGTGHHFDNQLEYFCSLNIAEGEARNGKTSQRNIQDIQATLELIDRQAGRSGDSKWSLRPRLYAILRNVRAVEYMDAFVAAGVTDFHLPFNAATIPECLTDISMKNTRDAFLEAQMAYLTKASFIEKSHHCILPPHTSGDDYFVSEKILGQGGFGSVDLVYSRLSIVKYARKRVLRGQTEQSRRNQDTLLNELQELRKLRHCHLVRIHGSYTDREHIAYLMKPIGESTLEQFLSRSSPLDPGEQVMVRRFYGCLAGAVDYLHRNKIRHRDLTARNVLIYRGEPYISDFGSAYNWASKPGSMTRHKNTPVSPDYMAPEVAKDEARGAASDMWSLGVVYLEITTKLLGCRIRDLKDLLAKHAKFHKVKPFPYANIKIIFSWIQTLGSRDTEYTHDKEPLLWVRNLLEVQPSNRPTSAQLKQDILESPSFSIFCCFKCRPMYEDENAEYPLQERTGPLGDSQSTSQMIENFMESFERRSNFGGMPVQRVETIREWISGTEEADGRGVGGGTHLSDIQEEQVEEYDSRLTDRLQYAAFESNYYTNTATREVDPTQWRDDTEDTPMPGSFPSPDSATQQPSETMLPDPVQDEPPLKTPKVEKRNLQDSGLGFLEYESVSSHSDDVAFQPFDEVSDNSTASSDDSSQSGDLGYATAEQDGTSEDGDNDVQILDAGRVFEVPTGAPESLFGEVDDVSESASESDPEPRPEGLFHEVSDHSDEESSAESGQADNEDQPVAQDDPPSEVTDAVTDQIQDQEKAFNDIHVPIIPEVVDNKDSSPDLNQDEENMRDKGLIQTTPDVVEDNESCPNRDFSMSKLPECVTIRSEVVDPSSSKQQVSRVAAESVSTMPKLPKVLLAESKDSLDAAAVKQVGKGKAPIPPSSVRDTTDSLEQKEKKADLIPLLKVQPPEERPRHDEKTVNSIPPLYIQPRKKGRPVNEYLVKAIPAFSAWAEKERKKADTKTPVSAPSFASHVPSQSAETKQDKRRAVPAASPGVWQENERNRRKLAAVPVAPVPATPVPAAPVSTTTVPIPPISAAPVSATRNPATLTPMPPLRSSIRQQSEPTTTRQHERVAPPAPPSNSSRQKGTQKKARIDPLFWPKPAPSMPRRATVDKTPDVPNVPRNEAPARKPRRPVKRAELPTIEADKLILDTWELASSMPTTVLSENTKSILSKFFFRIPNSHQIRATLTAHCRDGKASAVRFIVENISSHMKTKKFFRGPVWACINGASGRHNKCLRALIEGGANINIKSNKTGKTPLHMAVEHQDFKGYTNLVWLLVNKDADLNIKDSSGDCPLTKLWTGNDSLPLAKHQLAALAILLQGGAEVDSTQPGTGNTPLHLAVRRQDKLAVAMLLYKGANVNAKTNWGTTPLQMTANQFRGNLTDDHAQVLDLLLRNKAFVDETAEANKRTALHLAVISGTAQAVGMLLNYRADPLLRDSSGKDARSLAIEHAAKLTRNTNKVFDRRIDDHVEIMERLFKDKKREWRMNRGKCVIDVLCEDGSIDGKRIFDDLFALGLQKDAKFGDKGTIADVYSKAHFSRTQTRR